MRIGVDLMGSDTSPKDLFKAVELATQLIPQARFSLFLTEAARDELASIYSSSFFLISDRLDLQLVSDVIKMDDDPLSAVRQKKNASLTSGIRYLKKRHISAFVSAGNTGALIAASTLTLPLLPGIKRPALLALLPSESGNVAVIDVGGNVSFKAHHLAQFAQLGVAYQQCLGIRQPRVGLLNIGVESQKGTSEVRQAYDLMQLMADKEQMLFLGNVEGGEVFEGSIDVLVTDGFTGNVLLKASEGVSSFIFRQLQRKLHEVVPEQEKGILQAVEPQFDCEEYPGAIVCGVDGVVVKCHGQSSVRGFLRGIEGAARLVQNGFVDKIKRQLGNNE